MDKKQAQALIKETFESTFDKGRFVGFVKNLLNDVEEATFVYKGNYIPDAYEQYINTLERIGKYTEGEHKIDILIAKLKKETSIERARTMQRNFVAWYLNGSRGGELKDAALVAFVAPNEEDWRFSLVKMDYRYDGNRNKVVTEFTPARRWSFLVGINENSHTAQSQLVDLVADDERNPAIAQLEEAFNIEKVTKEFFEKYRGLFEKLSKDLKANKSFQIIASKENIDIDNFAKKLLGQIVFLYFLQKKGWLGVPQDKTWGQGDKFFLRTLFNKAREDKKDFYDSYLESLFYDTLNNPRRDEVDPAYSRYFGCKIPFLNGGLFEPDYDWKNTMVYLGNEIFKEIIETFDLYNFTVKEDEPLEKEVAVDPEMLGKVFENLLPENMRKGQGAYYTPREIVHYMCQESLINHLNTETELDAGRIRKLIAFKDEELVNGNGSRKETMGFSDDEAQSLDRALANIKVCDPACGSGAFLVGMLNEIVSARRILEPRSEYKLKKATIQNCIYGVDIDHGAVDIAKLRLWLSLVVDFELKDIEPLPNLDYKIMCGNSLLEELIIGDESIKLFDERIFNLKETKNNQPENSRKEELQKQLQEKQRELFSLHLNHKLSLEKKKKLEEDIIAINKELKPKIKKGRADSYYYAFFADRADEYFKQLRELHKQYFTEYDPLKKKEKRRQIEDIELEFIKSSIKEKVDEIDGRIRNLNMQNPDDRKKQAGLMKKKLDYLAIPEQIHKSKVRPYFLWKLNFFEVFQEKGGFDVVIANPPYVGHKGGQKKFFQEMKRTTLGKMFNNERMDVFYYFFHLSLNNVKQNGEIAFITTNYYVTADSAVKLRTDFKNRSGIRKLVNFNELKIFDTAQGQHNMLTFLSKQYNCSFECDIYLTDRTGLANSEVLKKILNKEDEETHYYILKQTELFEGGMNYIRLFCGAGNTQASINALLNKVKQQGVLLSQICNLSQGIVSGLDKISKKHVLKFPSLSGQEGTGVFVIDAKEKEKIGNSPLLKPWFKNSDINKYKPNEKNNQWVVHLNAEINLDGFPNIKKHLLKFKEVIEYRNYDSGELSKARKLNAWWALSSSRKEFDFTLPKIISPQRSYRNIFAYTEKEWIASADVYFITEKDKGVFLKYLLALLNSKLYYFWLYHRGKRKGEMLELYQKPLSEIPIKKITKSEQEPFVALVDFILALTKDEDYLQNPAKQAKVKEYERQIDQMVYELYGLSEDEIKIIEQSGAKDK